MTETGVKAVLDTHRSSPVKPGKTDQADILKRLEAVQRDLEGILKALKLKWGGE